MSKYTWKWDLDERGFVEVPFEEYGDCKLEKMKYVEKYLSPSIKHARCGWNHVVYYVLKNQYGIEEYVALYPDEENTNGRYICVSGNSLGAIAEAVWENIFN